MEDIQPKPYSCLTKGNSHMLLSFFKIKAEKVKKEQNNQTVNGLTNVDWAKNKTRQEVVITIKIYSFLSQFACRPIVLDNQ